MYTEDLLPAYLRATKHYGFTVEYINESCPADLRPYMKAYELERAERDMYVWQAVGGYITSSLVFSIDHCLNGRKAKTEYLDEPIVDSRLRDELKVAKVDRQRIKFMEMLQSMKSNFEREHESKGDEA